VRRRKISSHSNSNSRCFFVGLSTNTLLWPFLHTQTHTHTLKIRISLGTRVYSSFGGRVVVRHIFLKHTIKLALVFK